MVDSERLCFGLSAWNELAGVDDKFTLFLYTRNNGKSEIEIVRHLLHGERKRHLARVAFPLTPRDVRPGEYCRLLAAAALLAWLCTKGSTQGGACESGLSALAPGARGRCGSLTVSVPTRAPAGARLVIFGRQYSVEGYDDKHTRDTLSAAQRRCVRVCCECAGVCARVRALHPPSRGGCPPPTRPHPAARSCS